MARSIFSGTSRCAWALHALFLLMSAVPIFATCPASGTFDGSYLDVADWDASSSQIGYRTATGLCNNNKLVRVYDGADNPGTDIQQKIAACRDACFNKNVATGYAWILVNEERQAPFGFSMSSSGRCYCEQTDYNTCTTRSWTYYKSWSFDDLVMIDKAEQELASCSSTDTQSWQKANDACAARGLVLCSEAQYKDAYETPGATGLSGSSQYGYTSTVCSGGHRLMNGQSGGVYGCHSNTGCWSNRYFRCCGAPTTCTSCDAGQYRSQTGQSGCTSCDAGQYQSQTGQSGCIPCSPGKYQSQTGQLGCTNCAAGKYSAESGATSSTACATLSSCTNEDGTVVNTAQCQCGTSAVCGANKFCYADGESGAGLCSDTNQFTVYPVVVGGGCTYVPVGGTINGKSMDIGFLYTYSSVTDVNMCEARAVHEGWSDVDVTSQWISSSPPGCILRSNGLIMNTQNYYLNRWCVSPDCDALLCKFEGPVCEHTDGVTKNNVKCVCGETACAATIWAAGHGHYCYIDAVTMPKGQCTVVPYECPNKNGATVNDRNCVCGTNTCDGTTGLFCQDSSNTCSHYHNCEWSNYNGVNSVNCACGNTDCDADSYCNAAMDRCIRNCPAGEVDNGGTCTACFTGWATHDLYIQPTDDLCSGVPNYFPTGECSNAIDYITNYGGPVNYRSTDNELRFNIDGGDSPKDCYTWFGYKWFNLHPTGSAALEGNHKRQLCKRAVPTCTQCTAGQFSDAGKGCAACPLGKTSAAGSDSCTACAPGTYQDDYYQRKQFCDSGYMPVYDNTECRDASNKLADLDITPTFTYSELGSAGCVIYDSSSLYMNGYDGAISDTDEKSEALCKRRHPTCKTCPSNTYGDTTSATSCKTCSANTQGCGGASKGTCEQNYGRDGTDTCVLESCAPGYGFNATTQGCDLCDVRKYEYNHNASVASEMGGSCASASCPVGQGWTPLTNDTLHNVSGNVHPQFNCMKCPAGTFSDSDGTGQCSGCPLGYFQDQVGQSSCKPYTTTCQPGTKMHEVHTEDRTCPACEAGKYSNSVNTTACRDCTAGKYMSGTGATACGDCTAGKYMSGTGATACGDCSVGRFVSGAGATACDDCSAGKYM